MKMILPNVTNTIEFLYTWLFSTFDEFYAVILGTFFIHEITYFIVYLPFFIAENIQSLNKYKIQQDKKNTSKIRLKVFFRVFLLHVFAEIPLMFMSHKAFKIMGLRIQPPLPSWWTIITQIIAFFFIEDFWFYWVHRLLHYGPFYKYIHKVHHEYAAPFGITAEYAHPIETIILGLGTSLGPFLFGSHLLTLWIWLVVRVIQTVDAHSGYNFPWSFNRFIPFYGGAEFHDYHHMAFVGNYSSTFTIWDKVFGTDSKYQLWKSKQTKKSID